MMFALFSSPFSVDAQRVRYGYEWPCWETPPPPPFPPPTGSPVPPTLCERMKDAFNGKTISIGAGTNFPTSQDLIKQFGQVVLSQNIFVTGDFEVNESIIFRGCKLSVSKDKSIIVDGGNQLYSQRSKFFSCEGMWNGIYLNPKANIFLSQETEIEDAYKAVYATPEAGVLRINSTTFNRNQVGIFLEDKNKSGAVVNLAQFYNNKFDCTSELAITDFYKWSVAGVWADAVSILTLGTASANPNLFTGKIRTGIHARQSVLNVSDCRFERIERGDDSEHPVNETTYIGIDLNNGLGYGIYANERGVVKLVGLGKNKDAVFTYNNCEGGLVHTDDVSLEVKNCNIRSVTESENIAEKTKALLCSERIVYSANNIHLQDIDISDNYFRIFDHVLAISVHKSIGNVRSIRGNEILFEQEKALKLTNSGIGATRMIYFYNANVGSFNANKQALIENNTITINTQISGVSTGVNGIFLDGSNKSNFSNSTLTNAVSNNIISGTSTGIFLDNVCNTRVTINSVKGYDLKLNTPLGSGIAIKGSSNNPALNNTICNNTIDHVAKGLIFQGNCNESEISRNHIVETASAGLSLEDFNDFYEPVIGLQFEKTIINGDLIEAALENYWEWNQQGNPIKPSIGDAVFTSKLLKADPKLSQFLTDKNNPNYPTRPQQIIIKTPKSFSNDDWFRQINDYSEYQPFGCEGNKPSNQIGEWTALDESILNEEYGHHLKVTAWEAKRYLFGKMSLYPSLLENENRANFYKKMQNTSISEYEGVKVKIDNAFDVDANTSIEFDDLLAKREVEIQKVKEIIKAFNTQSGDSEWDIIGIEVVRAQAKPITALNEKIKAIEDAIDGDRMERLKHLVSEIENLTVSTEYEKSYQIVYSLWTKAALQNGYLDEADLSQIRIIAHECITRLGSSVLIARDLLPECEKYDDECPDSIEPDWIKVVKDKNESAFYPNPVDKILNISTKEFEATYTVAICSIEGKILKNISTEHGKGNYDCNVSDLNNGLYLINFIDANGKTLSFKKLIVQH